MIHWEKQFETGNRKIDHLNQRMAETINYMFTENYFHIDEIFEMILFYAKSQFAIEASFMIAYEIDNAAEQKKEHDHFMQKVHYYHIQYSKGDYDALEHLRAFLYLWFIKHVTFTDRPSYSMLEENFPEAKKINEPI